MAFQSYQMKLLIIFDSKLFTMNNENVNKKGLSEPTAEYETQKTTQGIGKETDLQERFKNGYTSEEFLAEMKKRIRKYPWKK